MSYFVTGTDTGVGKTLIATALLRAFAARGKTVAGMKPVAAGCDEDDLNADVKALRGATNVMATYGQLNPYGFFHPIAPHIAAHKAGVEVDFGRIMTSFRELTQQAEMVIVEGAGGFKVPLNDQQDSAELAQLMGLPVILVVGLRLGCINHALLTANAVRASGLRLAGWVANVLDANMPALLENIAALDARLHAPLLGVVKFQERPDARQVAQMLNIDLLEAGA
jgi:dethiobiotin synthetase